MNKLPRLFQAMTLALVALVAMVAFSTFAAAAADPPEAAVVVRSAELPPSAAMAAPATESADSCVYCEVARRSDTTHFAATAAERRDALRSIIGAGPNLPDPGGSLRCEYAQDVKTKPYSEPAIDRRRRRFDL